MKYVGMALICVIGTLLHFVYELSHHNKATAVFAAVNESTWEHIKICMTPTILWNIFLGFKYGFNGNFIIGFALSLLVIIILIPILFYAYVGFTKKSILPIDVICFYITVICSQLVFHHVINLEPLNSIYVYLSVLLIIIEMFCYFRFTFHPMINFIFKDPITHKYGLEGHPCEHHHHHYKEEK